MATTPSTTITAPPTPTVTPPVAAPQAVATPNAATAPVAYSFLDGSGYDAKGTLVRPPTVITASKATDDLAKKQGDLNSASTAMATQAQAVAANNSVNQANAAAPKPVTSDDINKIVSSGTFDYGSVGLTDTPPAGKSPVTDTTPPPDGYKYMYDQAGNRVQVPQSPTDTYSSQQKAIQDSSDAAYANFQNQMTQLMNGTFPLTPDQLSQVNALQAQFDQLKQQQQLANKNYEGGVTNAGIAAGRNRYAPEMELGNIQAAVSAGISKIADIDAKAASAISQLKQGFLDNDYQLINASYTAASDYFKQKSQTLNDITTNVREEARLALDKHASNLADQKYEDEKRQAAVQFAQENGVTSKFYLIGNTAINTETGEPVSLEEFQQLTGQTGKSQDETDFSSIQKLEDPAERKAVLDLMSRYGDAGISPQDSPAQAAAKLRSSALYRKDTYIAPQSSGNAGLDTILKTLQIQNMMGGTDAQKTAAGYADRVVQAGNTIDQLEPTIAGYNPIGFQIQEASPNALKSTTVQQYEQAARNFVNAVLRRESGAAISQSEFDNAYSQYLPRPGDSNEVLVQKKQNRDTQFANLTRDAGNAASTNTSSSSGGGQIIEYQGKRYQTDADGNFDPNKSL